MSVEMSEAGAALSVNQAADELADRRILKQLSFCVLAMMGVAVAILTTANSIA